MTKESKQRIDWIDNAKAIGIILVVLGHLGGDSNYKTFIYSFHMPLFFYLSGVCHSDYCQGKRIIQLLLNYVVISSVYTFSWLKISGEQLDIKRFVYELSCGFYTGDNPSSILWFLLTLASVQILVLFIKKIGITKMEYVILGLFVTLFCASFVFQTKSNILPLRIQTAVVALPFYLMGYHFRGNLMEHFAGKWKLIFIAIAFLISTYLNGRVDMGSDIYNNFFLFFNSAVLGVIIVSFISKSMKHNSFTLLGRYTMDIYVLHIYLPIMIKWGIAHIITNGMYIKTISFLITYLFIGTVIVMKEYKRNKI